MSLIGRLHNAEHQGREAAWERFSRALTNLEEAQSRMRRRMRLHPRAAKSVQAAEPIVTINGRDVPAENFPPQLAKKKEQTA